MKATAQQILFSPSDLTNFVSCPHLSELSYEVARGFRQKPFTQNEYQELLAELGDQHERAYLEELRAAGTSILEGRVSFEDGRTDWDASFVKTREALSSGEDIIFQAALRHGAWRGQADFLRRVDRPSDLGSYSYEVVDTKLASDVKVTAVLQVCSYSEMLATIQGTLPEYAHLRLGDRREVAIPLVECMAYFRTQKTRFEEAMTARSVSPQNVHYPEVVAHCDICSFGAECSKRRRKDDHLSLVAFLGKSARKALEDAGLGTVTALAESSSEASIGGIPDENLDKHRRQARLQQDFYKTHSLSYALLPPKSEPLHYGFAGLPTPTPDDVFFDLESDRWAGPDGLEYLFGYVELEDDKPRYHENWAHTAEQEKRVFEQFIDDMMQRWQQNPAMHVYHYAPYEPGALKRLSGRYEAREIELDAMLRGGLFVDLYRVVRQSLQASVESYSIKRFEPFYMDERTDAISAGSNSVLAYEAWRKSQDPELLRELADYNETDCISTWKMQGWLEDLRQEAEAKFGSIPRPPLGDPTPPEKVQKEAEDVRVLREALSSGIDQDAPESWSKEDAGRVLLARLLSWHRRESLSGWRRYYEILEMDRDELHDDSEALVDLEPLEIVDRPKQSIVFRYQYPAQEHKIKLSDTPLDPFRRNDEGHPVFCGTVMVLDTIERTIDLKRGKKRAEEHPRALMPQGPIDDQILRGRLREIAQNVIDHGFARGHSATWDLLLRRPPRFSSGIPKDGRLRREEESTLEAARRLVRDLNQSYLALQGPPGAGKTYTAAHMVLDLLAAGKVVGVTGRSHKVISNLLNKACEFDNDQLIRGIQKAPERDQAVSSSITIGSNADVEKAIASGDVNLVGGTEWLFCRDAFTNAFDFLFVDEAGQMSLANVLAASLCAKNVVLIGDPQQLPQPLKGIHPPGAEASVLEDLLEGRELIDPARGLFLDTTYRLHPDVCSFISEQFYRGELLPDNSCSQRSLDAGPQIGGTGIRFLDVKHSGCKTRSPEEANVIDEAVRALLGLPYTNEKGSRLSLTLEDILVVAPYNGQVATIASVLPEGARVGTVDKFQGQEAPVVFYSLTTSSPEDIPRGMDFLFSRNRLNVALSRAQCLAIVVANPELLRVQCRSLEQIRLANGVCAAIETATLSNSAITQPQH